MNYKKLSSIFAIAIFFITCKDPCKNVTCPLGQTCIDGKCHCNDSSSCPTGQVCIDGQCMCVGGIGGDVTMVAFPQHHTKPIYSQTNYLDTAYVKFNTQDFPGIHASDYDLVIAGDSGEDHVHIPNLKCGDYYIYMTGFDTSINQRVTGGIPYSFSQTSGEIDLNVPVTE